MSKSIIKQKRILTKASGGSSLATPVSVANGGTGLSSYAVGDIIYASGATTLSKLAIGTANQQLRVNAGATALEYFTPSGVAIGDTIGGSPVTGSVLMNIGTTLTQSINYRAQQATPFSTAFGFECHNSGSFSGVYNTAFGWQAGKATTTALGSTAIGAFALTAQTTATGVGYNTAVGYQALASITTGYNNTGIGRDAGWNQTTANECVFIGRRSGWSANGAWNTAVGNYSMLGASGGSYVTALGAGTTNSGYSYAIALGAGATNSAANELMVGGESNATIGSAGIGITTVCIGNGNTNTSAASVTIRTTAGSGTNNAGGNLTLAPGKSTGSATPAVINFQSTAAGASSSTAQTLATVLQITNSTTITTSDAVNYALGSTTGTKFGTANTQKLAFWNATPIVQPSGATQAAPAAYATGAFGLDSDANMQALYDLVVAMRTALVNVGIMKGSA